MSNMTQAKPLPNEFQSRMKRVEGLIQEIEKCPDVNARDQTRELVRTLMDFYGAGLTRIAESLLAAGKEGEDAIRTFSLDPLVGNLLMLHGLHPVSMETRVLEALKKVRPSLESHKGNVELLSIKDGVVQLRLEGSCDGCPSSAMTLKYSIEDAIYEAAPDVLGIEVEGAGVTNRTATPQDLYTQCPTAPMSFGRSP